MPQMQPRLGAEAVGKRAPSVEKALKQNRAFPSLAAVNSNASELVPALVFLPLVGGMSVRKTAAKFEINPSTVRVVPVVGDL